MPEMTIPEVRARLRELALELDEPELKALADQLVRRRNRIPAESTARSITPGLSDAIRVFAARNPDMSEHNIGLAFNVNQGRVSEALYGKRGER